MAKLLNKDPSDYKAEQTAFIKELTSFHEQKG